MDDIVSIIVPIHNGYNFLMKCIESVLSQTYNSWEMILVDDGSTDRTREECRKWSARDNRIRLICQQNQGVSAARNRGIENANGVYITFLDVDDWIEPTFLATLLEQICTADIAMCSIVGDAEWQDKIYNEQVSIEKMRKKPSQYSNPLYINAVWNKMFRVQIIQKHALRFPESVKRCEDAYFVQDYLLHCQDISVTDKKLYHYEQTIGSAMHSFYEGVCRDELPLMQRQYTFFHSSQLDAEEESAFWDWQYGKTLAILRYISCYAPIKSVRIQLLRQICENPISRYSLLGPDITPNKWRKLFAWIIKCRKYGLLEILLNLKFC